MQDLKTMKSNIPIVLTYPGIVYFNSSECFDFRHFQLRSVGPENDYILWSTKSYPTMQNPWDQKCAAHFLEKSQFAGNFFTCIPMLWISPATASWCRSDTTNCRFETAVSANRDIFGVKTKTIRNSICIWIGKLFTKMWVPLTLLEWVFYPAAKISKIDIKVNLSHLTEKTFFMR